MVAGALGRLHLGGCAKRIEGAAQVLGDWPVNLAHRGGAALAPENTLVAFREGIRVGAGGLDLDVHLSADGHVVVIHDETVDRTTNGSGPVREMTLPEIKRLDAGYWFTQDDGKTYPYRGQGVTIPTLEEVYQEFRIVPLNVEIKNGQPNIERMVLRVIERAGAEGRTLVISKSLRTIRRFREVSDGRVATGSSIVEIVVFYLLSRLHLSGLLKPAYQALQGPEFYQILGGVSLHVVTPAFIQAAHEQGIRVDLWTINSEPDMRRLLEMGVDGIITDRPDVLAQVLKGDD